VTLSGKPAISLPRAQPTDVTQALNNIQQRLKAIENEFNSLETTAANNTQVAALQTQINGLAAAIVVLQKASTSTPGSGASSGSSSSVSLIASEPIAGFRAVFQSAAGQVLLVDPTSPARAQLPLGVSTASSGAGVALPIQTSGLLSLGASLLTPGLPVWVGPLGVLTQTAPAAPTSIQIGLAVTNTQLVIAPERPVLITSAAFNPPTDGLMPASRSAGSSAVNWDVYNALVASEPGIDFEVGSGLYLTASHDPSNHRIVLTINLGSPPAPNPLLAPDDSWPHYYDDPGDADDWWVAEASSAAPPGANNAPRPLYDPSIDLILNEQPAWDDWDQLLG
jgi:hypothetical protein